MGFIGHLGSPLNLSDLLTIRHLSPASYQDPWLVVMLLFSLPLVSHLDSFLVQRPGCLNYIILALG